MPAPTWTSLTPLPQHARLPAVDELKGLALVFVVAYHVGGVLSWPNTLQGQLGVDVFLILSGVTLALSPASMESFGAFFRRRFLRIFPAYWLALALFLALDYFLRGIVHPAPRVWLHAAGLHGFYREVYLWAINDSFWFIALIVPLYVAFAFVRRRLDRPADVLGIGFALTALVCHLLVATQNNGGLTHLGVRIPSFFIGLVIGQALKSPQITVRASPLLAVGSLALAYITLKFALSFGSLFAAIGMITAYLALRAALTGTILAVVTRPLAWLGLYSYEIYLFHQPLIREYNLYVWQHAFGVAQPTPGQLLTGVLVGLVVTTLLSVVVHRAVNFLFPRRPRTA
jgi:peptidoglycan/LPS O-acetylase OafA/YrhL